MSINCPRGLWMYPLDGGQLFVEDDIKRPNDKKGPKRKGSRLTLSRFEGLNANPMCCRHKKKKWQIIFVGNGYGSIVLANLRTKRKFLEKAVVKIASFNYRLFTDTHMAKMTKNRPWIQKIEFLLE